MFRFSAQARGGEEKIVLVEAVSMQGNFVRLMCSRMSQEEVRVAGVVDAYEMAVVVVLRQSLRLEIPELRPVCRGDVPSRLLQRFEKPNFTRPRTPFDLTLHDLTPSRSRPHTSTILTPPRSSHLHDSHISTILTPLRSSHLPDSDTSPILTPPRF
ncbi:uncharacterized protein MYCGRDRAFT_97659 [Zymoseptoria tritici IPO323]|uniref:Uncharacterized protein n=1 Tax=Zymoseptoria tritici (strain CBS 115943 / IPO323) TaxID=336722 RepID=F9XQX1_ZYMTI|nr:uncharacterized protein MYCGRDRAFT_97659 [Zymoseptoria tritici IPO323]EGP82348.1 hypothetical protein MYCGRDRAFT_97659 [Zymoseptoria tritici IPO323]